MANQPVCHDVLPDCNNSTLPAQYIRTLSIKHMRPVFFFVIISAWVHVQMRSIFWKICQHCCFFACEISNIRGKRKNDLISCTKKAFMISLIFICCLVFMDSNVFSCFF